VTRGYVSERTRDRGALDWGLPWQAFGQTVSKPPAIPFLCPHSSHLQAVKDTCVDCLPVPPVCEPPTRLWDLPPRHQAPPTFPSRQKANVIGALLAHLEPKATTLRTREGLQDMCGDIHGFFRKSMIKTDVNSCRKAVTREIISAAGHTAVALATLHCRQVPAAVTLVQPVSVSLPLWASESLPRHSLSPCGHPSR
jgi:hypothetical protein